MSGRNNESSLEIEVGNEDWDIEIYFNKTFGEKILKGKPKWMGNQIAKGIRALRLYYTDQYSLFCLTAISPVEFYVEPCPFNSHYDTFFPFWSK